MRLQLVCSPAAASIVVPLGICWPVIYYGNDVHGFHDIPTHLGNDSIPSTFGTLLALLRIQDRFSWTSLGSASSSCSRAGFLTLACPS